MQRYEERRELHWFVCVICAIICCLLLNTGRQIRNAANIVASALCSEEISHHHHIIEKERTLLNFPNSLWLLIWTQLMFCDRRDRQWPAVTSPSQYQVNTNYHKLWTSASHCSVSASGHQSLKHSPAPGSRKHLYITVYGRHEVFMECWGIFCFWWNEPHL